MNYSFNVKLDDRDYYEYNKFSLLKSHYGKRQMIMFRIFIAVIFLLFMVYFVFTHGFSYDSLIGAIVYLLVLALFQILIIPLNKLILKIHLKILKKTGKMGYSPESVIEFCDETFTETTPDNKTEYKYSAVERVSVYKGTVFIHVNNIMSFILPHSAFESEEQFSAFIEFMKAKGKIINFY